ncbi:MAG TPA: 50S ribosomal protein L22 [Gaiellaceae bacterium]|jgi:large subunit ribosomal protein L22
MATVETPVTEARADARYVRTAPRKAQLVAEQIRGLPVLEARTVLRFMTRDAARDVSRVLESAVANATMNHGLDEEALFVSAAYVGSGPTLKRWRARARGRVARIKKRTCHISIRVAQYEEAVVEAPAAPAAEPEEKPKRAPRKKPAETETETAAEEPKPKRTTRKKAEPASEGSEAAEKPKRTTRARKPKAEDAAEEKPKPRTRRTTRKKTEEEES